MSIERLKELFYELKCIQYGRFELASGGISYYKIICDPLFNNTEAREILGYIGSQLLQDIEKERKYDIVGVATGGYEFARLVAEKAGRDVISVNPHNNKIKGKIENKNICYFEDVVTEGGSIIKCQKLVRNSYSIEDEKSISIVDRDEGSRTNLRKAGIELYSIFVRKELGI